MTDRLSDEILLETLNTAHTSSTRAVAASLLGISERTLRERLAEATRRNLNEDFEGTTMPTGYTLGKVTRLAGPKGTILEWQHMSPDMKQLESEIERLLASMESRITPIAEIPQPELERNSDYLTTYVIADAHIGQYSWDKESGEDYDLSIAQQQVRQAIVNLMEMSISDEALILNLGDHFHADDNRAETEKSHNRLDVDSRHDKVLYVGTELQEWMIEQALRVHDTVKFRIIPGNHDPNSSRALEMALHFRYKNNPRVTILRGPDPYFFHQWGTTMIMAHHGHLSKPSDAPYIMAAMAPDIWGQTKFRYAYMGHFHRRIKGQTADEQGGAIWEIFQAVAAKDAWNHGAGHTSNRSLTAIVHHKSKGEVLRITEPIGVRNE